MQPLTGVSGMGRADHWQAKLEVSKRCLRGVHNWSKNILDMESGKGDKRSWPKKAVVSQVPF